jgi:elongation factor G
MTVYATENIRNIAVVGHSDTGKTSLVSALLFDSGAVNRLCKVDDGNTTTDFDDDEHDRKITINTAVAYIEHRGVKVNLIDTPGYGIFSTDAMQGLRVADAALMMISAVAGIEVQTEKMWKSAAGFDLPVLFAVNLMDRDRASPGGHTAAASHRRRRKFLRSRRSGQRQGVHLGARRERKGCRRRRAGRHGR